jgi:hypothetical protein
MSVERFSIAVKNTPIFVTYGHTKNKCTPITIKGTTYYVMVSLPKNTGDDVKNSINKTYKLYTAEDFYTAPPGTYTWIESDEGFFAVAIRNLTEIATLHSSLAERTNSTNIYISGEARIGVTNDGQKTLHFNILSGTYMLPLLKRLQREGHLKNNSVLRGNAKRLFNKMGFYELRNVSNTMETFITSNALPITIEQLEEYDEAGYEIKLYDTPDTCKSASEDYSSLDNILRSPSQSKRTRLEGGKRKTLKRGKKTLRRRTVRK